MCCASEMLHSFCANFAHRVAAVATAGLQLTGDLTVGQVMTMLPYANAEAIFTIDGATLLAAVRHSLTAYPSGGRFLQVVSVGQQKTA